jgi:hypothetical protein
MTRFGRGPGLQGVKYACMRCKKDDHTDAECSFKDSATKHIAHQVQVLVAAALAPYLPTYSEIKQSGDVEQYTTIPSRILLDSAASTTMALDTRHHHRTARSRTLVTVANANKTRATATGPATLPTFPTPTTLDVLAVPGIRDTLLAASQVAKASDILIQQDEVFIIPKSPLPFRKDIRAICMLRNGVYEMHVPVTTHRQPVTRNVHANLTHITSTLHNTFNYAPATTLRRLVQHSRGTANLNKPRDPAYVDCHSCAQGKRTRAHFPAIHRPPPAPLDVISTDTAGPLPRSHDNARYLQILPDRATRYLLTVPLPSKSAATDAIRHAIARLQLNTGRTVRRYHAGNAREQHAEPVRTFLLRQGTEMSSTSPHTSQQNPHA